MTMPVNAAPNPSPSTPRKRGSEERVQWVFAGAQGIRAGWRWLIFMAILFLCAALLNLVEVGAGIIRLEGPNRGVPPLTVWLVLTQEANQVLSAFFSAFILSKIERRPWGQYGLPRREAFGRRFWQGAIWGILAISLTLGLIASFDGFRIGSMALSGWPLVGYAVLWAVAFLLTGFFEEFTFRGYSQFTLTQGMGFWPAAVLLSLIFGSLHLTNPGEAWTGGLGVALIGFFFCFTLKRTGNIWFAVGLHAAWNFGETFVFAVPDSGLVAPGHLLNSSFHGPRWLTGGSVGPEASVMCFLVMALLFAAFHFAYPARKASTDS